MDARISGWAKCLFALLRLAYPDEVSVFHHRRSREVEEDGLTVELTVLVWLLPKAEPQIRLGCRWLIWEGIPRSTNKNVGGERQEGRKPVWSADS